MTMDEFKKVWDKYDGWNRCMLIIFDNSGRWIMNRRKYHKVYKEIKDSDGNIVNKELIPNSPKGFLKEDGSPDWMDLKDYLKIDESTGVLEMKRPFIGTPPDEELEPDFKKYFLEVRHVENIQMISFADEKNEDYSHMYPISMT